MSVTFCKLRKLYRPSLNSFRRFHSTWDVAHSEHFRRTNSLQKTVLGIGAAAIATCNPLRADMVNALNETTGTKAAKYLLEKMKEDSIGRQILEEKPRLTSESLTVPELEKMEDNTLGKCYYLWLKKNEVTPDTRQIVHYVEDPELAYVIQRYREIHDFYHVLLELDIDLLGETVVKAFEAVQTGFPMCYLGIIGGVPNIPSHQRKDYFTKYLPWALKTGSKAKLLMNYKFEDMLDRDIHELREELNIETFDSYMSKK